MSYVAAGWEAVIAGTAFAGITVFLIWICVTGKGSAPTEPRNPSIRQRRN